MRCGSSCLRAANQSVIDFDLDLAVQQNDENPVFYVQYADARMASILRTATERGFPQPRGRRASWTCWVHPAELTLLRKIAELPEANRESGPATCTA